MSYISVHRINFSDNSTENVYIVNRNDHQNHYLTGGNIHKKQQPSATNFLFTWRGTQGNTTAINYRFDAVFVVNRFVNYHVL